ncbi:hypothetical protein AAC387_Pa06g1203 [Persea americana]
MASPPFLVEDQTDGDFFDKLVDDEFGITKPFGDLADSIESDEAKTSAKLSINDESAGLEESGDIGLNSEREDLFGSVVAPPPEVRAGTKGTSKGHFSCRRKCFSCIGQLVFLPCVTWIPAATFVTNGSDSYFKLPVPLLSSVRVFSTIYPRSTCHEVMTFGLLSLSPLAAKDGMETENRKSVNGVAWSM